MSEKKADVFDLVGIRTLVELMKDNDVSELDLEQGESRLKLRRGVCTQVAQESPTQAVSVVTPVAPVASVQSAQSPALQQTPKTEAEGLKTIVSPMVGTFYASPSPDAPSFVKVGDLVSPDKTVCIIEAMKVFNDIQAEISGKIVAVLVKNGDQVEYGAPLFKVDPRG